MPGEGSVRVGISRVAWPARPSVIIGHVAVGGTVSMRIEVCRIADTLPAASIAR